MAKRIVFLCTARSLLGSRHAFWLDSMLGRAMQLYVTRSAHFVSTTWKSISGRATVAVESRHM